MDPVLVSSIAAGVGLISGVLGVFLGAWLNHRFRMKEWEEKDRFEERKRERKKAKKLRAVLSDTSWEPAAEAPAAEAEAPAYEAESAAEEAVEAGAAGEEPEAGEPSAG